MTSVLFGAAYSLVIGRSQLEYAVVPSAIVNPELITNDEDIPPVLKAAPEGNSIIDYRTTPSQNNIQITDLHIEADVSYTKKKSKDGGNQNTTIKIYNLSTASKAKIVKDGVVVLKAGYRTQIKKGQTEEDLPLLFVGQIQKVSTLNNVTTVVCGDSLTAKKNLKVSDAWPPDTTKRQVLQDLLRYANNKGVPTGRLVDFNIPLTPWDEVYPIGYSVKGLLFEEIAKICSSVSHRFYTVNGKMYVEPKAAVQSIPIVRISGADIRGNAEIADDNSGKLSSDTDDGKGIKIKIPLNGSITTDKAVKIVDTEFAGTYKIVSIDHSLSFEGNRWTTTLDLIKLR